MARRLHTLAKLGADADRQLLVAYRLVVQGYDQAKRAERGERADGGSCSSELPPVEDEPLVRRAAEILDAAPTSQKQAPPPRRKRPARNKPKWNEF